MLTRLIGWFSVPSIDPVQAQARLAIEPTPFLLDVRQPEEYAAGHIAGATLIPVHELPGRLEELPRDREVICVCQSGMRGRSATRQLVAAGFNVVNVKGGTDNWIKHGLPVKQGNDR